MIALEPRTESALELMARAAWHVWGSGYALYGRCDACGEQKHVRGKRRSFCLCLECFDLGEFS